MRDVTFQMARAVIDDAQNNYRYQVAEFINNSEILLASSSQSKREMHAMELLDGLENPKSTCLCFVDAMHRAQYWFRLPSNDCSQAKVLKNHQRRCIL